MGAELFNAMAGIHMVHVPYRGQAPALSDVIGGQVHVMFAAAAGTVDYIRTGKLRALAVTTPSQAEVLRDLPAVGDFVPGYTAEQWYGLGAPKGTPAAIVERLNAEVNAALADPAMKSRFAAIGGDPLPGSPADFGRLIADETEKWAQVIRSGGIKTE
jgi:tripartite-type tricarboxylate transporter receptor subunit TctC